MDYTKQEFDGEELVDVDEDEEEDHMTIRRSTIPDDDIRRVEGEKNTWQNQPIPMKHISQ